MYKVECISGWEKKGKNPYMWMPGEGFMADSCDTSTNKDGSIWWVGKDVDGVRYKVPTTHFRTSRYNGE